MTTMDQLGRAKQVKVQKENTIIVDGAGSSDEIKARIHQIKAQIETTTSEFDKEKLQERSGKTVRRRCGHQSWCGDRSGDEGEKAYALKTLCPRRKLPWRKASLQAAALR